ncbi:Metallo-beta-lactamase superfamily protein [Pleurostoma richardsiae]|uniref:Metallo-beta-lactamase superfamily protein n=1 Tax=Pleurostoma richardsiae TaxID=41990 RepID=A0AA38VC28_9PEZI|nr:Metallo-beta-lactamase superfamily protein [Pleurostoma richardsiae]
MATQLVQLPEVERLSPRCIRILGGNPGKFTLQGTNTYLLGTGSRRLLIDTGEGRPSWIAAIKRTLEEEKASITAALITHWHHDHQGGIRQLLELSPDTKVFKNQGHPQSGQLDITDGQKFEVEGVTLRASHTPGHTVDHMVFVLEEDDALFTGDNVLGHGTAVFEELGTYLDSLEQMKQLFQGIAYPGHGPVIDDGPDRIRYYIRHRRQREEQLIQALQSPCIEQERAEGEGNSWAPIDLVRVIYQDVPENLHLAAQGGLVQILRKLEKEGKVSQDQGKWRLKRDPPTSL